MSTPAAPAQPTFSFVHILQLVQVVPSSSKHILPPSLPSLILPSRLAKTTPPFPVAPPTNLDALYAVARQSQDPEEVRKERNRKKKERKERSKARKAEEGVEGEGEGKEDGEGKEGVVAGRSGAPSRPIYGLPADIAEWWIVFETHYHRMHAAASQQRQAAWAASYKQLGEELEGVKFGDIILHDSTASRGKRDNMYGGFARQKDGAYDFHWVV